MSAATEIAFSPDRTAAASVAKALAKPRTAGVAFSLPDDREPRRPSAREQPVADQAAQSSQPKPAAASDPAPEVKDDAAGTGAGEGSSKPEKTKKPEEQQAGGDTPVPVTPAAPAQATPDPSLAVAAAAAAVAQAANNSGEATTATAAKAENGIIIGGGVGAGQALTALALKSDAQKKADGAPDAIEPSKAPQAATPQDGAQKLATITPAVATEKPAEDQAKLHPAAGIHVKVPGEGEAKSDSTPSTVVADTVQSAAQTIATAATQAPARAPAPAPAAMLTPLPAVPIEIGMQALRNGSSTFEIRLDPQELGRVEVRLRIADSGQVSASLVVDRVETLHMLQREAKTLERAFEQAGLKSNPDDLQFSLRRDDSQQGRAPQQDFIEASPAPKAEADASEAVQPVALARVLQSSRWNSSGVDIQV